MQDEERDLRLDILIREMRRPSLEGRGSKVQALRDAFFSMIERGSWRPGERLIGEREFAERLSVSLGTVQNAMRSLAAAGLVERRRGAGTFIANAEELGGNVWHFRFRTEDGLSLVPFEITVLSIEETVARGQWSDFLGPCPSYVMIRRIIEIGREFKCFSEVYLDAARFRPLLDLPLDILSGKNLRIFLHDRYNAPTLRAVHRIRNHPIEAEIADLIGCTAGASGLHLNALGYSYRNAPISFQRFIVPPNRYSLEILG